MKMYTGNILFAYNQINTLPCGINMLEKLNKLNQSFVIYKIHWMGFCIISGTCNTRDYAKAHYILDNKVILPHMECRLSIAWAIPQWIAVIL
jgi:hypothetical protein